VALDIPGYDDKGNRLPVDQMKKLLERLVAPEEITLKVKHPKCLQIIIDGRKL
jgi:hypothetical protein